MISKTDLISVADAYKDAAGILRDQTVSYRVFGDSKKLSALRGDGDVTLGRFNTAMQWFRDNWPDGAMVPDCLLPTPERDVA